MIRRNDLNAGFPKLYTEQPEPMSPSESRRDQTKLEEALRSTKPWFAENGTTLIYALAAVLTVAAVVVFLQRQSEGDIQASRELGLATDPEQYRDVADSFPETTIGIWARLRQGDRLLDNAVGNMFTNREVALEELGQAEAAYQRLAERSDVDEQVRERVLIGLARIAETRCDGKEETKNTAVDAWKRVLNEFSESIVKKHAEERVEHLQSVESQTFYAWFHEQNPTPDDPGLAPGQPAVPDMPSLHNLTIPESASSTGGEPGTAEGNDAGPAEADTSTESETPENPEASTEPVKSESASETETPADKPAPSGEEEVKAADDPAAAAEEGAGTESPESDKPEAPAENNEPASDGGDGNK